jgi:hypothetical protein
MGQESVKSSYHKDFGRISKNGDSQTDKAFNLKDFKFTDLDSLQHEEILKS